MFILCIVICSLVGKSVGHMLLGCIRWGWSEGVVGQNKQIEQNWTWPSNFDICFCVIFSCYGQSLISWRKTGHWAFPQANFKVFSWFPKILFKFSSNLSSISTKKSIILESPDLLVANQMHFWCIFSLFIPRM